MIPGFYYKVMNFRDLPKLLAIAPKSLKSNPQHLETNYVPFSLKFSTFIHVYKVVRKISWPLCAFCWTHHPILWPNSMIVSLSYPYMTQLSLYIRFT